MSKYPFRSELFKAVFDNGDQFSAPCSKVVCVGRNYAAHAEELNNPIPEQPILFVKPESTIQVGSNMFVPREGIHYECELAVLIAEDCNSPTDIGESAIAGLGLGLDLTDRELQSTLKEKGHPWERAKSFNGASYLSKFVPFEGQSLEEFSFKLSINNQLAQHGNASDMLFSVFELLGEITQTFHLKKGDVVLTGTPKGVGRLQQGDLLAMELTLCHAGSHKTHSFELFKVAVSGG